MKAIMILLAAAMILVGGRAEAQFPERPITAIVPIAAGGGVDGIARILSEALGRELGQTVVIDNRPGANGAIGASAAARARPDGYTLFITTGTSQTITPALVRNLPYDPVADFTPIAFIGVFPLMLVTHPSLPVQSIQEFIAHAKSRPGELTYGQWSTVYLAAGRSFELKAGVKLLNVPYRGSAAAMNDLIAGRISMSFVDLTIGMPLVQAGSVRPLAVTVPRRSALLPDVPTLQEAGLQDFDISAWMAIYGPAGLPPEVVERLSSAALRVMGDQALAERLIGRGFELTPGDSAALAAFQQADARRWRELVAAANITIE